MTVSGETRITSPIISRPILKATFSKAQIQKLTEQKKKLLSEIAVIKARIVQYSAYVSDIKAKIDARKKAGISENADLEAKMKALKKALLQDKKDLALLMEKLAYVESKLK